MDWDWIGLDWNELDWDWDWDWIRLDWIGMEWMMDEDEDAMQMRVPNFNSYVLMFSS